MKQRFQTTIGQRVKLKDGADHVYTWAASGSQGWVRDQKHEQLGYPMVYIEWDKRWWGYNGEEDNWFFESHFEPVEEVKMSDNNVPEFSPEEQAQFMKQLNALFKAMGQPENVEDKGEEAPVRDEYTDKLENAIKFAGESDAFVLFAVKRQKVNGYDTMVPAVFRGEKSVPTKLTADLFISQFASVMMEDLVVAAIEAQVKKGDYEPGR